MALNLSMMRGKSALFSVAVTLADGTTPDNITGNVLYFMARFKGISRGVPYDVRIIKSSDGNGITVTDPPDGMATVELSPADTIGLPDVSPAQGIFSTQCDLTLRNGSQMLPLNSGPLTVMSNVGDEPEEAIPVIMTLNITGDGSTHQLAASGSAVWVQFSTRSGNSSDVWVGVANVTDGVGIPLEPGDTYMYPAMQPKLYDLSKIYYWVATGDHLDIQCEEVS